MRTFFEKLVISRVSRVSSLNVYIQCPHFKMETRPSDWMFLINLKDAYLYVPIHPASYKRLAVMPMEVYYFQTLPFGLNMAPLVFTQIVESMASYLRLSYSLHLHV